MIHTKALMGSLIILVSYGSIQGMELSKNQLHILEESARNEQSSLDARVDAALRAQALRLCGSSMDQLDAYEELKAQKKSSIMKMHEWAEILSGSFFKAVIDEKKALLDKLVGNTHSALDAQSAIDFITEMIMPLIEKLTEQDIERLYKNFEDLAFLARHGYLANSELLMSHPAVHGCAVPHSDGLIQKELLPYKEKLSSAQTDEERARAAWDYYWRLFRLGGRVKSPEGSSEDGEELFAEEYTSYRRYYRYRLIILSFLLTPQQRLEAAFKLYKIDKEFSQQSE